MDYIFHFICAFIATIAFSTILQTPKRALKYNGTIGAFGWIIYRYLILTYSHTLLAAMISSIFIGILSAIIAISIKMPTITLSLPCLIPIVPGAGMYYTMYYLILSDTGQFTSKALETTLIALSLATGVFVSANFVNIINRAIRNRKNTSNIKKSP